MRSLSIVVKDLEQGLPKQDAQSTNRHNAQNPCLGLKLKAKSANPLKRVESAPSLL